MSEDKFLNFVMAEAEKIGRVFILDSGEGRDMPNPPEGMEVEDLSGWLLTPEQAASIPHRTRGERDDLFEMDDLPFVMVRWGTTNGMLTVRFDEVQAMA